MGHGWNHKRVHRIYCSLKLNKRREQQSIPLANRKQRLEDLIDGFGTTKKFRCCENPIAQALLSVNFRLGPDLVSLIISFTTIASNPVVPTIFKGLQSVGS